MVPPVVLVADGSSCRRRRAADAHIPILLRIAAAAAQPNIYMKIGGIGMPSVGFDWHLRDKPIGSEELASNMAPIVNHCIEQFGPNRCMFESNFPVDRLSVSYRVLYNALKKIAGEFSEEEQTAMFSGTASRVYRI